MINRALSVMLLFWLNGSMLFSLETIENLVKNKDITYCVPTIAHPEHCVFVCDVGGTNTRCALVEVDKNQQNFIFVLRVLTQDIAAFADVISQALAIAWQKYNITVTKAVCAVAGSPTKDTDIWMLPHVVWSVGRKEILQKTPITSMVFLNDFEAIGYSLEVLTEKDLVCLNRGIVTKHENKVILGAGTGLGKCIVAWNPLAENYVVVQSGGAHADFPIHSQKEIELIHFLQNESKSHVPVRYEVLLSGQGIAAIYKFFEQTGAYAMTEYTSTIQKHNYDPAVIARYKDVDDCCKKTFELFTAFYGRAAKNFAIEAGAFGGVYLAGGIAAKNPDMFSNDCFMPEFLNNAIFKDFLKQTPIFIIMNQDAGLLGAAHFAYLRWWTEYAPRRLLPRIRKYNILGTCLNTVK